MPEPLERLLLRVQKPARYVGGEFNEVVKDLSDVKLRMAFCFPDIYEIGMSNLGMQILYGAINAEPDIWCERVFAPWGDMAQEMRAHGVPLYALESGDPLDKFDVLGFSLGYEMAYCTVLDMLDMAGIPLRSADRPQLSPLVFAGGTSCCNPEPMAPFFDLMVLGEGEEAGHRSPAPLPARARRRLDASGTSCSKRRRSRAYTSPASMSRATTPTARSPSSHALPGAPETVTKRIVEDLDAAYYPTKPVVPSTEIVHDRVNLELFRGCVRGCRFCQAGYVYRPIRARSAAEAHRAGQRGAEKYGQPGGHAAEPFEQRLPPPDGEACDGLAGVVRAAQRQPLPAQPEGGQLLHGAHEPPAEGAARRPHLRARGRHAAPARRHKQERHRGGAAEHLPHSLRGRLERHKALFHARPAHGDGRGRRSASPSWRTRSCTPGANTRRTSSAACA